MSDDQFRQALSEGAALERANGKLDGLIRAVEIIKANPGAGTRELCRLLVAEADTILKGQETVNGPQTNTGQ